MESIWRKTCDEKKWPALEQHIQAEAALRLGIDAAFEAQLEIPVICAGGVCFPRQAEFHPLKFLENLAGKLKVYENTMVIGVEDNLRRRLEGRNLSGGCDLSAYGMRACMETG